MSHFSKRSSKRSKKIITRRKKNRFTRKYRGLKHRRGLKNGLKNGLKYGGAAAASVSSATKLPMIIDQNQVTYTCTPVPTS